MQTTDLQKAYQEFIRLFRFLRNELERQMPDFRFQNSITENAMDYAYFSFTYPGLKEKVLKLVVVFDHKNFRLEVWLSGVNRTAQCRWAEHWSALPSAYGTYSGTQSHRLCSASASGNRSIRWRENGCCGQRGGSPTAAASSLIKTFPTSVIPGLPIAIQPHTYIFSWLPFEGVVIVQVDNWNRN